MPIKVKKRSGSKNFYLRGAVRGQIVRETTGTSDEDAADAIRIKREAEILNRSVFGRETISFVEAAVNYTAMVSQHECRLVNRLASHFKVTPLADIGQEEIDHAAALLYPKATNETRNRCVYTPVSAIMRKAGHIIAIRRPKQKRPLNRAISQDDVERIVAATEGYERAYVLMLFYAGTRPSEALDLKWDQVSLRRRHISLYESKTDRVRAVRVHERLLVALANLSGRDGYVFPWRHRSTVYRKWWWSLMRELGLEEVTPHVGRHSFATRLREAGHDLKKVKEAGGWLDIKSVERYAAVSSDEIAEAIDSLPIGPKSAHRKAK